MYFIINFVVLLIFLTKNIVLCETFENVGVVNDKVRNNGDLLFVQLIFRHGDRTPLRFYKNDPWDDQKYWKDNPGQLTNLGKQQQFELGIWLRKRYLKLLNDTYSENNIYVESSDIDRTIMSAEVVMAAMYRPENKEIWNMHLPWQPIPVHTVPLAYDHLVVGARACETSDIHFRELLNSDQIKQFDAKHQPLYDYLTLHSGDVINRDSTVGIRDTLMIEATYNKSLPNWTKRIFPGGDLYDSIEEVALFNFRLDTSTPQLAKIKGGFLLKDILDRFTNKSKLLLDPDRSMWVYSGHDTTVCRMLNTLGVLEHMPPYSSCIMFEMRNINDVPHIQIFFKNSSATPEPINIPNCGTSCPLANFYILYKDVLPSKSYEEECTINKADSSSASPVPMLLLPGILSILLSKLFYSEYF